MVQLKAMWEPGSQRVSRGTDAQKVAEEILAISDTPTVDQVVEMASNPETESYGLFDWDDAVAGPKWRKEQARLVMRVLKVEFVTPENSDESEKKFEPVRLLYGNPIEKEGFATITTIMGNKDMYDQLLERAKIEIKTYRKKYAMLKELEELFDVIDKIE